ncbi:unnamed protein product [Cylicocyclus nassatus]|uniref:Uncharacterized protein n=1 Tax=Cylicocyclus nassatus TaxID=53992 RepID=A0AA36GXQ9_CYLNA|nr:unnamed protein product [Cylicocyclus nassatus]
MKMCLWPLSMTSFTPACKTTLLYACLDRHPLTSLRLLTGTVVPLGESLKTPLCVNAWTRFSKLYLMFQNLIMKLN